MARSGEEERRLQRRRRLTKGLVVGTAAFGLPALYNLWRSRQSTRIEAPEWGEPEMRKSSAGAVAVRHFARRDAPKLVFLHSLAPGHCSAHWRPIVEHLAGQFDLLTIDWPGWGDSERRRLRYDSNVLKHVLDELLPPEPCHLVAAGLSIIPCLKLARERPSAVQSLVLTCPRGAVIAPSSGRDVLLRSLVRLPVLGTSAVHMATSRTALGDALNKAFTNPTRIPPGLLDLHDRLAHLPGSQWPLGAYLSGQLEDDVRDTWRQVTQRSMLLWGADAESPELALADLWLKYREANLIVVDDAGSLPHLEQPEHTAEILKSWVRESSP